MKIVYFGSDPFVACFEQLLCDGNQIVALFTFFNPNDWSHEEEITRLARANGIPIRYDRITVEEADSLFATGECDMFFSAEYDRLIPIPERPDFKGINIHNTLLPEGRGFFPVETQLYLRRDYGGVTIHKLTQQMDDGDILFSKRFDMPIGAGVEDVYAICADIARQATGGLFSDFDTYWKNARPQTGPVSIWSPTTRQRTLSPLMETADAAHLWRCYRKFSYVMLDDIRYRILDMQPADEPACMRNKFQWIGPDAVVFKLKEGAVCLKVEIK